MTCKGWNCGNLVTTVNNRVGLDIFMKVVEILIVQGKN